MRRVAAAIAAAVLTAVLAGCGDDGDTAVPDFTPSAAATTATPTATTATATATTATTATTAATRAQAPAEVGDAVPARGTSLGPEGNPITVGRIVAPQDGAQRAVLLAYLRFWVERARALLEAKVDDAALKKVATGQAAAGVRSSVRDLAVKGNHAEGGSTVNVGKVTVNGDRAKLTECFQDLSVAVDADGRPAEPVRPTSSRYTVDVVKKGRTWRVSRFVRDGAPVCAP